MSQLVGTLPEGWVEVALADVLDGIESGANFRCIERPPTGNETGVVKISAVSWGRFDELESKTSPPHIEIDSRTLIREGDFLISRANTIQLVGACVIVDSISKRLALSDKVLRLRIIGALPKWILYCLRSPNGRAQIEALATGNQESMRNIGQDRIRSIRVPLPPLTEQHRIVAAIEQQFTRLDAAIASLQRARANLKRYRAAVLAAATSGRLVPGEAELRRTTGGMNETGLDLRRRILEARAIGRSSAGRRTQSEPAAPASSTVRELPEGWSAVTVEELTLPSRPSAYGVLQPGSDVADGVPFVRVGDIDQGRVAVDSLKRIASKIAAQYPRTRLHGGEVLITLVGSIGRTAVVPGLLRGANVARAVGVIPLTDQVLPAWVEIWFRNPDQIREMTAKAHEVARKTLNLEDVRSSVVALPPLAEQQRIVAEVDRRLSSVDEIEADVEANLKRAERLRQAILTRSFEGKLVPQDPTDEPGTTLLDRIRADATTVTGKVVQARRTTSHATRAASPVQEPLPL